MEPDAAGALLTQRAQHHGLSSQCQPRPPTPGAPAAAVPLSRVYTTRAPCLCSSRGVRYHAVVQGRRKEDNPVTQRLLVVLFLTFGCTLAAVRSGWAQAEAGLPAIDSLGAGLNLGNFNLGIVGGGE